MIKLNKNIIINPEFILSVYEINKKCYVRYIEQDKYKLFKCDCSFSSLLHYIKTNRGKLQLSKISRKYFVNPDYIFEVEKRVHGSIWVKYGNRNKPYWIAVAEKSYINTLNEIKRSWRMET